MEYSEPKALADYACHTGEGPAYHPDEDRVYWVDIPAGRLFRLDPNTGQHEMVLETDPIGGFTIQEDGSLLLFMAKGAIKSFADGKLRTVIEEIPDERTTRFNDVVADPAGRVFCGTMPTEHRPGRLYRLDTDGTLDIVLEGVGCANGMGFTSNLLKMYFTDTSTREISVFDYDRDTGELSTRHRFVKTPEGEGWPDGMCVDEQGYVWSTRWDGGCVVRYAPDGQEVLRINLPVRKVSSVTFGGPDLRDIYLTTAGGNAKETDGDHAGALFHIRSSVTGVMDFRSRIKIP
jgi:D-xylonolactonase